jgi:hypothetical protein
MSVSPGRFLLTGDISERAERRIDQDAWLLVKAGSGEAYQFPFPRRADHIQRPLC